MRHFEPGLLGQLCWLELATGERIPLAVQRWRSVADNGDEFLLGRCRGPTLDVGCGPGRLASELVHRGIIAMGVDISTVAVALTTARGAPAIQRDVFAPLPGRGRWRHILLADGNIGIGGDPVVLLRRVRDLLGAGGTVLVELDSPGSGLRRSHVRLNPDAEWFEWAWVGADAVHAVGAAAGLNTRWVRHHDGRWFAELESPPTAMDP